MIKKTLLTTIIIVAMSAICFAQDLNTATQDVRNGIFSYLKKEGYVPNIEKNGILTFKREGRNFCISFDKSNSATPLVTLYTTIQTETSKNKLFNSITSPLKYVTNKDRKGNEMTTMSHTMLVKKAECFNDIFYDLMAEFDNVGAKQVTNNTQQTKQEKINYQPTTSAIKSGKIPLTINNIELANTHKDNTIIDLYGEDLFSDKVLYIKPRVTYTGHDNGTYTLYTKWFDSKNNLIRANENIAAGFSQEGDYTIDTDERHHTLFMKSVGYDVAGKWAPGNYRIEIWFDNTCLKSLNFTIKEQDKQMVKNNDKLTKIADKLKNKYGTLPVKFQVYEGNSEPYFTLHEIKVVKGTGINLIFRTSSPANKLDIDERSAYIDACENKFNEIVKQSLEELTPNDKPETIDDEDLFIYCLEDPNEAFISGTKL